MRARIDQVLEKPTALVALLCLGQIVTWTLAPVATHRAPPLDVVEGYMWGREWVIATFKHPALPSWVLEASRLLTGAVGWPAYLVSQLFIAATFVFVFLLGREMVGPRRAAAGTLLLTGIAFYAWPTPEFNHNVAETPFWAALPWALWHAVERRRLGWWILVGLLGALGLYAKFTTALLLVTLAAWILWDRQARDCLRTPAPWIGLGVFLVLVAPLVHWLVAYDFQPFRYAAGRSAQSNIGGLPLFVASVALNLSGMLAMLVIAGLAGPMRAGTPDAAPDGPAVSIADRAVAYLTVVTCGPLVIAIAGALATSSSLKSAWGSSMFNLAGVLAVALASHRFTETALRRIAACAAVLIVALPLGYAVVVAARPLRADAPVRVNWPQAGISKRFEKIWKKEVSKPLRIVAGDDWVAGLVGLTAKDRPSILNRGTLAYSPWITPRRIEQEGVLIVWDNTRKRIPEAMQPLVDTRAVREERFGWKRPEGRADLAIGYAIVAPK